VAEVIHRRDMLIGGACVAAAAAAYGLRPRRRVSLQGAAKLDQILPRQFGEWSSHDVTDLVAPKTADSMAARLYDETVGRVYTHAASGTQIMMLLAHGDSQSNDLQVHRPEVCYPAFGFAISDSKRIDLPLSGGVRVPSRRLVATAPGRIENIIYWSRLGEFFPTDGSQQRLDRLTTSVRGYVADGLLARFSSIGSDPAAIFTQIAGFIDDLVRAVPAQDRASLIGTVRAKAMAAART
jgi:EpsI family protein